MTAKFQISGAPFRGQMIHAVIEEIAEQLGEIERREIERRILQGEDFFEIPYGRSRRFFMIPSWRRHPINRLRIVRARRRYERGEL